MIRIDSSAANWNMLNVLYRLVCGVVCVLCLVDTLRSLKLLGTEQVKGGRWMVLTFSRSFSPLLAAWWLLYALPVCPFPPFLTPNRVFYDSVAQMIMAVANLP